MNNRTFTIPAEDEEQDSLYKDDQFATSPIMDELSKQTDMTTPIPDADAQDAAVDNEMSNSDEIQEQAADLASRQPAPSQQMGNLTPEDIQKFTTPKSTLDRYAELKALQDQQRVGVRNAGLVQAANQIAQGIASGGGAKIGDASESAKMLKDQAGLPIEQYLARQKDEATEMTLGNERELNDANSDISKFAQQRAAAIGAKIGMDAEQIQKLTKMTAKQLEKLGFKATAGLPQNQRPEQQSGLFGKGKDGKLFPLTWDGVAGKYKNPLTGEIVGPETEVLRNTLYTDAMGNKIAFGSQGASTIASSARDMKSPEELNKTKFSPDKEQREALDKETQRIDGLTKNANEKIGAANRILSALDGDSKQALAVIKTQMPRLAGEVGNLNQSEQEVWGGSQAWLDRAQQYINSAVSSELTDDNKRELRKVLGPFLKDATNSINTISDSSANRLAQVYNIPPDFAKSAYGVIKKVTPRQEEVMAGKVDTPKKAEMSNEDKAAISWAKKNPKDPRAKKILEMHGM